MRFETTIINGQCITRTLFLSNEIVYNFTVKSVLSRLHNSVVLSNCNILTQQLPLWNNLETFSFSTTTTPFPTWPESHACISCSSLKPSTKSVTIFVFSMSFGSTNSGNLMLSKPYQRACFRQSNKISLIASTTIMVQTNVLYLREREQCSCS